MKRTDNQLLAVTHLSQLLYYFIGIGGFILPLILWLVKKDSVINMDKHGKAILNFQISIFLYALISVPLIFLFGFGLIALFAIVIMSLILPIVNAVNSSNGKAPYYPFSLHIIN
ncbi:DUF4870 domain-containing protein [Galbibacter sp.]|uniref:DUF4870 domain-containing protein n=1 Tax=Galbibacter sp. TaxID=2918471 RepID=UPI002D1FB651|nr:DUF4870 domain-containing protein [Galbibacter sp.]